MKRLKSFNLDTRKKLLSDLAVGLATGITLAITVLPACWDWMVRAALGFTSAITGRPPYQTDMGTALFENPFTALPRLLAGAEHAPFLLASLAMILLCIAAAATSHLAWRRWLYDGTWVGGKRAPGASVHGDARLISNPHELKRMTIGWDSRKPPRSGTLAVGVLNGRIRLLDSVHTCVLAESGEGKSRRIALLSALAIFKQGKSLVINDIKGELRAYLEPSFRGVGTHRIVDVMFDNPACSIRFDPLKRAKDAYEKEGSGGATRELRELARCIVPTAHSGQPFFTDGARNLFVGLALVLIMKPDIPDNQRTVMSISAALAPLGNESGLKRLGKLASSLPVGHPALPFLSGLTGESGGAPGIVSTLATYLSEYADENVARMLHDDECALDRMGEEPTVVFISSSSATGNYKRLVQTFVAQSLSSLRTCAAKHAGRLPIETVLLLDEAASLGRNERIIQDLGEMRSEGIHVLWFCQSLLQLQSVSGYSREEAETILDLLKDKVVLSCSNLDTAKKISESMGAYTALSTSRSKTKSVNNGSSGTSEGLMRRPLITPDELQRWTGREVGSLVIHDGKPMALPSRDVSETFVGRELGMTSPEAERTLLEQALTERTIRNPDVPPIWDGSVGFDVKPDASHESSSAPTYTPEGF